MFIHILYMDKECIEKKNFHQMITTEDSYNELNLLLLQKIKDRQDSLMDRKFYTRICFYWNTQDTESFKKYASKKMESDNDFLTVVDKMIYTTKSITGNQVFENTRFNYDALKLFCNLEEAKDRIESIINMNEELYKSHKKGCDLFIRFYDCRDNDFIPPIIE